MRQQRLEPKWLRIVDLTEELGERLGAPPPPPLQQGRGRGREGEGEQNLDNVDNLCEFKTKPNLRQTYNIQT